MRVSANQKNWTPHDQSSNLVWGGGLVFVWHLSIFNAVEFHLSEEIFIDIHSLESGKFPLSDFHNKCFDEVERWHIAKKGKFLNFGIALLL